MKTRDRILTILNEIKPTYNLENVNNIVDGGFLDSLEMMSLISALMKEYQFELDIDWITPENFNSVDSIVSLIEQIKK